MKTHLEHYSLREKLHTEVLQEKYGKIDVQVLQDDDHKREVLLTDKDHIARTYAITLKKAGLKWEKEIFNVNQNLQKGMGIGQAFRALGFHIQKNVVDVYVTKIPEWLQRAFATESKIAKARITEFMARKGNVVYNYGVVTEIYSPDFRKPAINNKDRAQINIPTSALRSLGFTEEEIWVFLQRKIIAPHLAKIYSHVIAELKQIFAAAQYSFSETQPENPC